MSNRHLYVDREIISGRIAGVDFGSDPYCIARSPTALLMWVYGQSWSLNGHRRYSEPVLIALPDRSPRFTHHPDYLRLIEGGRLGWRRIIPLVDKIEPIFPGNMDFIKIVTAARRRQTLLIEGGGPQPQPSRKLGEAAYRQWRERPGGGFINLEADEC